MAISGIGSSTAQAVQPHETQAAPKLGKAATPQPKSDVVTISTQGKTAVPQVAQYSPAEEQKESATQKAIEAQAGKR